MSSYLRRQNCGVGVEKATKIAGRTGRSLAQLRSTMLAERGGNGGGGGGVEPLARPAAAACGKRSEAGNDDADNEAKQGEEAPAAGLLLLLSTTTAGHLDDEGEARWRGATNSSKKRRTQLRPGHSVQVVAAARSGSKSSSSSSSGSMKMMVAALGGGGGGGELHKGRKTCGGHASQDPFHEVRAARIAVVYDGVEPSLFFFGSDTLRGVVRSVRAVRLHPETKPLVHSRWVAVVSLASAAEAAMLELGGGASLCGKGGGGRKKKHRVRLALTKLEARSVFDARPQMGRVATDAPCGGLLFGVRQGGADEQRLFANYVWRVKRAPGAVSVRIGESGITTTSLSTTAAAAAAATKATQATRTTTQLGAPPSLLLPFTASAVAVTPTSTTPAAERGGTGQRVCMHVFETNVWPLPKLQDDKLFLARLQRLPHHRCHSSNYYSDSRHHFAVRPAAVVTRVQLFAVCGGDSSAEDQKRRKPHRVLALIYYHDADTPPSQCTVSATSSTSAAVAATHLSESLRCALMTQAS
jgi:hypothetical protein